MADPEEIIEVIVLEQRYAVSDLRPTASKARRSPVWNHFRFLPSDETMIVCIHCWPSGVAMLEEKKIITRAFSSGTESLQRHLRAKHGVDIFLNLVGNPNKQRRMNDFLNCSKEEKKEYDFQVFQWLAHSQLPFSMVNNPTFKNLCQKLRPGYLCPSVETLKKILTTNLENVNSNLQAYLKLKMVSGALSADGWTSGGGHSYFGILLHFICEEGRNRTILLDASPKSDQTSEALAERVRTVLTAWGLGDEATKEWCNRKIQYFTSDTTNAMPKMVKLLGFHWIPCVAHVLNLVVKDALKSDAAIIHLLERCRKICTFFSKSAKKSVALKTAQVSASLKPAKILIDVKTRWNSTLRMIECIVKNKVHI
jgi:hypothetical protein